GIHKVSEARERNIFPDVWPNRLREIREAEGETIVGFCKKTGLNDSRVSRSEQHQNAVTLDFLAIYAHHFRRPLSDFIGDNYKFCDYDSRKELSRDEANLIENFRRLTPEVQGQVTTFVNFLAMLTPTS